MIIGLLRYWYVWVVGVLTTVLFLTLSLNPQSISTAIVLGVYILLVSLIYWLIYRRSDHKITIATTFVLSIIGFFGMFVLVEDAIIRIISAVLSIICISGVMYIPQHFTAKLAHEYKPWRRMFVSIITVALYACIATVYGLDVFFQAPGIFWYGIIAGLVSGFMAYAVFRMYHVEHTQRMFIWACVIGLLAMQVCIVLSTLTFGYLLLGGMYVLLWYTGVVLVRFHLSPKGIIWKRQRVYLVGTVCLLSLLFMFARWL